MALGVNGAAGQDFDITIAAQPMSDALQAISRQTGTNILFAPDTVAGFQARPLHGIMSAQAALKTLLSGTGLEALPDRFGGLIVRAASSPTPSLDSNPTAGLALERETVTVSASRIDLPDYEQSTPTTVLTLADLEESAYPDIGDALRQLPMMGSSISPNNGMNSGIISGATAGTDTVDLRNLGVSRTLVLFDGQRVVQSNITGEVDLGILPTSLVQRADVVTGGASAAWGSDAIAGVVNLVLDKNFNGARFNIEGSDASLNQPAVKLEGTWGSDFSSARGHIILSGSYYSSPDAVFQGEAPWNTATYLFANPAFGQPGAAQLIHVSNVGFAAATPGGVVTGSAPGASVPGNYLRGVQFTGPSADPAPFSYNISSGIFASGGATGFDTGESPINLLALPNNSATLFSYASYAISDALQASLQMNYGRSWSENDSQAAVRFGDLTVYSDNAYLPGSLRAVMAADDIPSIIVGTTNTNNADLQHISLGAASQSLGIPVNNSYRQLLRGVLSLQGSLGDDWSWSGYYERGDVRVDLRVEDDLLLQNYLNAVDAVMVTGANQGTSGVPVGSIACRSTLTNPSNGCQPLDIFGTGVASRQAISYVSPGTDFENLSLNENVASFSAQGTAPSLLGSAPLAIAFGGEYRDEEAHINADPRGESSQWYVANFSNFAGHYNVVEGFLETNVPLIQDAFVETASLNLAGRLTDYSTSGLVETWKLGLTTQINSDIRLRATWSADIRAPNLSELFLSSQINTGTAIDPHTGQTVSITAIRSGNPNLVPEIANTISGGAVLTPHALPGFDMTADWYSIDIRRAIYTPNSNQVLAQCELGIASYCSQIIYNGTGYPGALGTVELIPVNALSLKVSGLDLTANYAVPFYQGRLAFHLIGNYTDEQTQTSAGRTFDYAGSLGPDSIVAGFPKLRATAAITFSQDRWQATVQGRFIGAARINNAWIAGVNVDDNDVPGINYLDLRASYRWTDHIILYGAIDNVLDVPPPIIPPSYQVANAFQNEDTRGDIYDELGVLFRLGVRLAL